VVRDGKELKVEVPVLQRRPLVIPDLEGGSPSYFVYGAARVFQRHNRSS